MFLRRLDDCTANYILCLKNNRLLSILIFDTFFVGFTFLLVRIIYYFYLLENLQI